MQDLNLQARRCILHVCGGDPHPQAFFRLCVVYSPRMWR